MKQLLDCNIDFCTLKSRCSVFFGGSGSCLIKEDLFEYTRGPFFRFMFAFSGMHILHNLTCSTTCKSLPGEREFEIEWQAISILDEHMQQTVFEIHYQ